jgi:hypothetical protein
MGLETKRRMTCERWDQRQRGLVTDRGTRKRDDLLRKWC